MNPYNSIRTDIEPPKEEFKEIIFSFSMLICYCVHVKIYIYMCVPYQFSHASLKSIQERSKFHRQMCSLKKHVSHSLENVGLIQENTAENTDAWGHKTKPPRIKHGGIKRGRGMPTECALSINTSSWIFKFLSIAFFISLSRSSQFSPPSDSGIPRTLILFLE